LKGAVFFRLRAVQAPSCQSYWTSAPVLAAAAQTRFLETTLLGHGKKKGSVSFPWES